jgi:hypothetical protein
MGRRRPAGAIGGDLRVAGLDARLAGVEPVGRRSRSSAPTTGAIAAQKPSPRLALTECTAEVTGPLSTLRDAFGSVFAHCAPPRFTTQGAVIVWRRLRRAAKSHPLSSAICATLSRFPGALLDSRHRPLRSGATA